MSMLSAQRDRLRELADRFDGLAPENAALIRSAADTIWELRCKLNDEQDEVAKLREQGARLFDKTLELVTENAKLRELVRDMEVAFIHGPCYRWCEFKEPCNGDRCQYRDRMRELGVEVDA